MGEGPGAGGLGEGPTGTRRGAACLEPLAPGGAQPPGLAGDKVQIWCLARNPGCPVVPPSSRVLLLAQSPLPRSRTQCSGCWRRSGQHGSATASCSRQSCSGHGHQLEPGDKGTKGEGCRDPALPHHGWNRRCQDTRTHFWGAVSHFRGTGTPFAKGTDHHRLLPEAQRWLRTPDPHVPQRTCPRMPEYF